MDALIALEDGRVFPGKSFTGHGEAGGEVVFNTSMTGYQEILTDPSYAGQMVVMTAPHIGNTGINLDDDEARQIFLSGLIVHQASARVSNWRASASLGDWLASQNIVGIDSIDTRALTRRLRDGGSQRGIISTEAHRSDADLLEQVRAWPGLDGIDMVQAVSCPAPYVWRDSTAPAWEFRQWTGQVADLLAPPLFHVVAYDFGIKYNLLRRLGSYGCRVTVVPAATRAEDVLALHPDGVFLSNGPGDPSALPYTVEAARVLLGRVPILGICLGHQILGQAFGGWTYRLKFGHHGGNQPVKHLPSGRVEISAHNHNFAVDPATLPPDVEVTHINLNDGCCEGMRHRTLPVLAIQYHPEAAPGPHDADALFAEFAQMMAAYQLETVR